LHIAPVWYFTPFYSILRATTENVVLYLQIFVAIVAGLSFLRARSSGGKIAAVVIGLLIIVGMYALEAKVWGVVLMGVSVLIFLALPWLDHSPVKSIRYKGPIYKIALALFVISFFVLGYLGVQAVTPERTLMAQIFMFIYFGFFVLMPWYSTMDKTKPVPERLS
jgi:ubiquinol-cytochrome c reductase cytochrome b subunit